MNNQSFTLVLTNRQRIALINLLHDAPIEADGIFKVHVEDVTIADEPVAEQSIESEPQA